MKFGVCAPLEKMDLLAAVGYDYIELGVQSALIPEKDEADPGAQRRDMDLLSACTEGIT